MEFKYYKDEQNNNCVLISDEGAILLINLSNYNEMTSYNELPNYYFGKHKFREHIKQHGTPINEMKRVENYIVLLETGEEQILLAENGDIYTRSFDGYLELKFIYCNDLYMRVDREYPKDTKVNDNPRLAMFNILEDDNNMSSVEVNTGGNQTINIKIGFDGLPGASEYKPSGTDHKIEASRFCIAHTTAKDILLAVSPYCEFNKGYAVDYLGNIWSYTEERYLEYKSNKYYKYENKKYKSNFTFNPSPTELISINNYHAKIYNVDGEKFSVFQVPIIPDKYFKIVLNNNLEIEVKDVTKEICVYDLKEKTPSFKRMLRSYPEDLELLTVFKGDNWKIRVLISRQGDIYKVTSDSNITKEYIPKLTIQNCGEFIKIGSTIAGNKNDIMLLADNNGDIIGLKSHSGEIFGILPTSSGYTIISEQSYNYIGAYGRRWLDSLKYGNFRAISKRTIVMTPNGKPTEMILCCEKEYNKEEDVFQRIEQLYYNLEDNQFYIRTMKNGYQAWDKIKPSYSNGETKKLNI